MQKADTELFNWISWLVRSSLDTNRDFHFLNERIFWFLNRRKVTQSDACLEHVQFFLRRAQAERFNFCWFFGLPCTPRTTSELFNLLKLWQFSSRLILFEHSCFLPLKFDDLFDHHNLSLSHLLSLASPLSSMCIEYTSLSCYDQAQMRLTLRISWPCHFGFTFSNQDGPFSRLCVFFLNLEINFKQNVRSRTHFHDLRFIKINFFVKKSNLTSKFRQSEINKVKKYNSNYLSFSSCMHVIHFSSFKILYSS